MDYYQDLRILSERRNLLVMEATSSQKMGRNMPPERSLKPHYAEKVQKCQT